MRSEATAPPPASRIYGVSAVALYEAMAPRSRGNRPLAGQLNGLTWVPEPLSHRNYHWPAVANAALARTVRGLFPTLKPAERGGHHRPRTRHSTRGSKTWCRGRYWSAPWSTVGTSPTPSSTGRPATGTPSSTGVRTCRRRWREPGSRRRPLSIPTPLQPCWGALRPMVLESGAECGPRGHPPFSLETTLGVPCRGPAGLRRRADPDGGAEDRGRVLGGQCRRDGHARRPLDRGGGPAREAPPPEPGRGRRGRTRGSGSRCTTRSWRAGTRSTSQTCSGR